MLVKSILTCLLFGVSIARRVQDSDGCSGVENANPVVVQDPVFVKQVRNGKLFMIDGNGAITPPIWVPHVWGTPFEMGVAYGELLGMEMASLINETFAYFDAQIDQYIEFFPPEWIEAINTKGVNGVLDYVGALALPFVPARYIEEMEGMSKGSGIAFELIYQMAMIPEVFKAGCSMVGAWATASVDGSLYQLRALDWDTDGPFQKYPQVIVYHPKEGSGRPYSVVSWTGLVGSIGTGMNAELATCEKKCLSSDFECNGLRPDQARTGTPFNFVLRDVLQYTSTNEEAIDLLSDARRTCAIFVGVGSKSADFMNVLTYTHANLTVFNSTSPELVWENHEAIKDVIYIDKHAQPSTNPCLQNLLKDKWGALDAAYYITDVAARLATGDMHAAVYDYARQLMYVSNAEVYIEGQPQKFAYQRSWAQFNIVQLLGEAKP